MMEFVGITAAIDAVIAFVTWTILCSRRAQRPEKGMAALTGKHFSNYLISTCAFLVLISVSMLTVQGKSQAIMIMIADLALWVSLVHFVMLVFVGRSVEARSLMLTLLLALGVPCSAQLGIVLGMLGALPYWATLLWFGIVGGSLILVGFLSSQVLPGQRSDFMMEIPPIRKPTLFNIFTKTTARLEWYLKEVVPLFILGTVFLFVLDKFKLLPRIQAFADPLVVQFLHLPKEATEAFLIGFLRRDYGATQFFDLYNKGRLDSIQAIVSLIVMTLFVPCLANVLMIVKERGLRTMIAIVGFIYPFAFLVGGIVNWGLRM